MLGQANGAISKYITHYSILLKGFYEYAPYGGVSITIDSLGNPCAFRGIGLTPIQLLQCASFGEVYGYNPGLRGIQNLQRTIIETMDKSSLFEPIDETKIDTWKRANFYGYELRQSAKDKLTLYKKMQADLSDQFNIYGKIELREQDYWALSCDEPTDLIAKGNGRTTIKNGVYSFKNMSVNNIVAKINELTIWDNLSVIDETNIKSNVDLAINTNTFGSRDLLVSSLKAKGLNLQKKHGKIPMLIIKDKVKTTAGL